MNGVHNNVRRRLNRRPRHARAPDASVVSTTAGDIVYTPCWDRTRALLKIAHTDSREPKRFTNYRRGVPLRPRESVAQALRCHDFRVFQSRKKLLGRRISMGCSPHPLCLTQRVFATQERNPWQHECGSGPHFLHRQGAVGIGQLSRAGTTSSVASPALSTTYSLPFWTAKNLDFLLSLQKSRQRCNGRVSEWVDSTVGSKANGTAVSRKRDLSLKGKTLRYEQRQARRSYDVRYRCE